MEEKNSNSRLLYVNLVVSFILILLVGFLVLDKLDDLSDEEVIATVDARVASAATEENVDAMLATQNDQVLTQVANFYPSNTPTPTDTWTPTATSTSTATATATPTSTYTPSSTPTATDTPTATFTATQTYTPTVTHTPTSTFTPSMTFTPSATFTPTLTPTATRTPVVVPESSSSVFESSIWTSGFAIAYSPDGTRLAAANSDDEVIVVDVSKDEQESTLGELFGTAYALDWSPDGRHIVAGDDNGNVIVWKVGSEIEVFAWDLGSDFLDVAWSPDGRWIAGLTYHEVVIWDAVSGAEMDRYLIDRGVAQGLAWAPDGRQLVFATSRTIEKMSVRENGRLTHLEGIPNIDDTGGVYGADITWSPDGQYLAAIEGDRVIVIRDATSLAVETILLGHRGDLYHLTWSPDSTMVASTADDDTVRIWDAHSSEELYRLNLEYTAFRLDWSPDGQFIALRTSRFRIWNWGNQR